MALTDDRTMNKGVQLDYNMKTQQENIDLLKETYPDNPFEYVHYSTEYVTNMRNTATDAVTAKKGAETDKERWGINYCIYVLGKMHSFDEATLRASDIYPDFEVTAKPEKAIQDRSFVFDEKAKE